MEILAKLGVECVNDLDQEQRRKFVGEIKQTVDASERIPF